MTGNKTPYNRKRRMPSEVAGNVADFYFFMRLVIRRERFDILEKFLIIKMESCHFLV